MSNEDMRKDFEAHYDKWRQENPTGIYHSFQAWSSQQERVDKLQVALMEKDRVIAIAEGALHYTISKLEMVEKYPQHDVSDRGQYELKKVYFEAKNALDDVQTITKTRNNEQIRHNQSGGVAFNSLY